MGSLNSYLQTQERELAAEGAELQRREFEAPVLNAMGYGIEVNKYVATGLISLAFFVEKLSNAFMIF